MSVRLARNPRSQSPERAFILAGMRIKITGDELGQNRRLMANGTLDLELTYVPAWGYHVGNEVFDVDVEVSLTDDDGNSVFAAAAIDKF